MCFQIQNCQDSDRWPFHQFERLLFFSFFVTKSLSCKLCSSSMPFFDICKIRNVLTGRAALLSFPAHKLCTVYSPPPPQSAYVKIGPPQGLLILQEGKAPLRTKSSILIKYTHKWRNRAHHRSCAWKVLHITLLLMPAIPTQAFQNCEMELKGTQDWDFFWLWFGNL